MDLQQHINTYAYLIDWLIDFNGMITWQGLSYA